MKNFRWIIFGITILFLNVQVVKASDETQEFDPKKLAHLQIPLSVLQMIWLENPVVPAKQTSGEPYLALAQARGFKDCLYFFSLHTDFKKHKLEDYNVYFEVLKNPKYKEKLISPITMRVLGVYGHDRKNYYQGTYEIRHEGLPPFRFHTLAIEQVKEKQFEKGVAFYILNTISKKDSTQLSTLCKEEHKLTVDGKRAQNGQKRWVSLENLIGEKVSILQMTQEAEEPKKKRVFTRGKPSDSLTQNRSGRSASVSAVLRKPSVVSASEQQTKENPSSVKQAKKDGSPSATERRKGNFSLLQDAMDEVLNSVRANEIISQESASASSSSSAQNGSGKNIPVTSSSSQAAVIGEKHQDDRSKKRTHGTTSGSADDLSKKK